MHRRRFLLGLGATALASRAGAGAPSSSLHPVARPTAARVSVTAGAEELIAKARLSGTLSYAVADLETGTLHETHNPTLAQPPASVIKTLTALYALETFGAAHRFRTDLVARGSLRNGILDGDLILVGGGDPTTDTDALADMAAQLKQAGVNEVRGRFIVHDGLLPYVRTIDSDQPDHLGYSPAVAGVALNYNRVFFEWKRATKGYEITMDARSARVRPAVEVARMKLAARAAPVYTYAERRGVDEWTVAQGALGKGGGRWLPVRNPAGYVGDVFRTLARAHGIALKPAVIERGPQPSGDILVRYTSPPLQDILRGMLKYSNNLTAEMVGLSASVARGHDPRDLRQSGDAMAAWAEAELGMTQTRFVDHSGLGDASRMSPTDLVKALVKVGQRGILRPLLKPWPMRDAKGRAVKNHPVKVDAKTGTLHFVSGLGGYFTAPNGREMAFAIFAANMDIRSGLSKAERERPPGARTWNGRAKLLQSKLLDRWATLYR
jgi:D-alanyl-D-alanine carboxypeptidase/D-alanyl-D-alanine-endopeptidase (penicillin-binding protein 4)